MRKAMLVLLSVLLVEAALLALAACKRNCDKIGHDWGKPTVDIAVTCGTAGKTTQTCNRCGEVHDEIIEATGNHVWVDDDSVATTEPTCVTDGTQPKKCAVCGAKRTEEIQHIGEHDWKAGAVTKEATCLEAGEQTYECSVCHEQENRELAVIDHTYGELHDAVAPTCVAEGNVAYYQCFECKQFFDADKKRIENVAISVTGVHAWNLSVNSVVWIWPDTYAEFVEEGVRAVLECSICNERMEVAATAIKKEAESTEPTYTQQGTYVFTAEFTFDGTTVTNESRHTYTDIPVLPDGKPDEDYMLDGNFGACSVDDYGIMMTWNIEEQVYEIEQEFWVAQTWSISACGNYSICYDGSDIDAVTYADGVTQPPTDLFTVLTADGFYGKIRMEYDCTLLIKLDVAVGKISIHVKRVVIEMREAECYFSGGINGWAEDDPDSKFEKQADGTFTLTVTLDATVDGGLLFKIYYNGVARNDVVVDYDAMVSGVSIGKVSDGNNGFNIRVAKACTLQLTYNPDTDTLTIVVLH